MAKIYRRETLISGVSGNKKEKKRKRNVILNFRVSEEEKRLIEKRIELCGMSKADFLINSCLHQSIITYGNIKTFEAIKKQIFEIEKHLLAITQVDEIDLEILESLRTILEILSGLERRNETNE